ncbi:MAG: MG2 domain-containing protein, partial [Bacteroidota bacterium]
MNLELYDMSQQVVHVAKTNSEGVAKVQFTETPFLLVAKRGEQRGYLKLIDGEALSLSRFDVTGAQAKAGLRGFIYGERGVWRPGDPIHLTFVLDDSENPLPADHPVTFELRNPQGQLVDRIVENESVNGFYAFTTETDADATTGNYAAQIAVGGTKFSKTIKVETIMPNRLKINFDYDVPFITAEPGAKEADLSVTWLHGAVAKDLKAEVQATLLPAATAFDDFRQYTFDDPGRAYAQHIETIFSDDVNSQGRASFPIKLAANDNAPGKLRATFLTKVFEPGGAFSVDQFSHTYHPYNHYVGVLFPQKGSRRPRIMPDQDQEIEIVTVDREGNPVAKSDVTVSLYEVGWRWWWDRGSRETINYNAAEFKNPISADTVATDASGKARATIRLDYASWGRFLIRACDKGGHCSGTFVYASWYGSRRGKGGQPGCESMLTFSSDKESYNVGEEVTLSIPTPAEGRALVSLESGTEVLSTHWIDAEQGTTTFTFEATAAMAPNIYANVTLLQPHAQTANDLPIRLYGVIPIKVYDAGSHLKPEITMADVIRPESPVQIQVSEATGRPMTYTVAVVDEGLLDLTRFKTPNPWDYFFARQALSTKTWDVFDHVVGASSLQYQSLLGIGGGAEEESETGVSKVNRFRPVVKYLGPFELGAGKTASHTVDMPLYVGSVRTMVVAGNGAAFGAAEKATPVRKPLMLLGTLPRVLGPEEEVDFYLSVFAMEDDMGDVEVEIDTNELIELTGMPRKIVSFDEAGEEVITFPMKIKEQVGQASIRAIARKGSETAEYNFDIDVRHPNPAVTLVKELSIQPGETLTLEPEVTGIAGTNSGMLEVSLMQPLNLEKRLRYLMRYPHGCVEQTTSGAFPQLYLSDLLSLEDEQEARIERNVNAAISRLARFQRPNGGFSYWPGRSNVNDWGTNYAGHFLLAAKSLGYDLPADLLNGWLDYQVSVANNWVVSSNRRSELIQAYRLYLLALADKPQLGAMNRFREGLYKNVPGRWMLAAAYHQIGQKEVAASIANGLGYEVEDYKELSFTYG